MSETYKEILLITAESGEGQFEQMIDPELHCKLLAQNLRCHTAYLPEVTPQHLAEASAIVLMRTPMPGHAKDDSETFRRLAPQILERVAAGAGLVIMFSESYGRSEGTLNEFTRPLGLNCYFNYLNDPKPENRGMVTNLDSGRTIRVDCNGALLGDPALDFLEIVVEGGHGTQHLTCEIDSSWVWLLRGRPGSQSSPFPLGLYSNGSAQPINEPVLGAVRKYGKGRIAVFPASAPLWVASGYLRRFKNYLLGRDGENGFRFLHRLLAFAARDHFAPAKALLTLNSGKKLDRSFSFTYAASAEIETLRKLSSFRLWVGYCPQNMTVDQLVDEGRKAGCAGMVILADYSTWAADKWRETLARYQTYPGIDVLPGYEQIDGEGNASVVFAVDELPDQRMNYPNSNLLEDLLVKVNGYAAVYARPQDNRCPYYRQGGYNLFEYDGAASLGMFRQKTGTASSLGLITVNRGTSPAGETTYSCVLAPEKKLWRRYLTENFHYTYVASGVEIRRFGLFGKTLMRDDWEGYWYEWDKGEEASLEIILESASPIRRVTVWDGDTPWLTFTPDSTVFELCQTIVMTRDLRLTVSAESDNGNLVSSYPVLTRNRHFWAHVGSDQMNDYHNVFMESPSGMMGIGDRFYEPYGFVTCGYAWGDYVRITSPVPWSELMPSGIEISSMTANFKSFHPSLFMINPEGRADFLNNHFRRLGECDDRVHLVHSFSDGCWLEEPGTAWIGHGGRTFHPTRSITRSKYWRSNAVYTIGKWQPYCPIVIDFAVEVEFLRPVTFSENSGFILGQSIHQQKEDLAVNGLALGGILNLGIAVDPQWKEWDNLMAFHLFEQSNHVRRHDCDNRLTVTGDESGTYCFELKSGAGQLSFGIWEWRENGFLLSYELLPARRNFAAGDVLTLNYQISLG